MINFPIGSDAELCWQGFRFASNLLRYTKDVAREFDLLVRDPERSGGSREGELLSLARKVVNYFDYEEHEFEQLAAAVRRSDSCSLPYAYCVVNLEESSIDETRQWIEALLIGKGVHGDGFVGWLPNMKDPSTFLSDFQQRVDEWSRIEPVASGLLMMAMYMDEAPKKMHLVLDVPETLSLPEPDESQLELTDVANDPFDRVTVLDLESGQDADPDRYERGHEVYDLKKDGVAWPTVIKMAESKWPGKNWHDKNLSEDMKYYCQREGIEVPKGRPGRRKKRKSTTKTISQEISQDRLAAERDVRD